MAAAVKTGSGAGVAAPDGAFAGGPGVNVPPSSLAFFAAGPSPSLAPAPDGDPAMDKDGESAAAFSVSA
jgi:hypothetical protein